ncbi:HU family DNA-binding protein [Desulfobacter vibrioformis]|uniref:HU family DNA-binding protein n=1 Tax=Desulfobacter vibrioformis TaxID=34031 RepID=UPI0005578BC1|nr:HU family DNA-binding protein [Desulfobacter vibrioformis]
MNKLELIQTVKDKTGLSKQEAIDLVRLFFDSLTDAMINGERIEIRGFCSFFKKEYAGYIDRNPKTGENVSVPAKRLPFFKPGKELRERVDYQTDATNRAK